MLRGTGGKTHVSNASPARVPFCSGNGLRVGINPVNPCSERRDAECEAAVAAPEVQDALPAHEGWAAPLPELVQSAGPEGRRQRRDVSAEIADRVRRDSAHGCVQLKPGRAGEIRTRGLLVPNRGLRPTVFGSILARHRYLRASLLTRLHALCMLHYRAWEDRCKLGTCPNRSLRTFVNELTRSTCLWPPTCSRC